MARSLIAVLVIPLVLAGCGSSAERPPRNTPQRAVGLQPLSPLESNRRYFTDGSARAVYLTGFHTWSNLVDRGGTSPPERFDFAHYLDELSRYRHNFIRLWAWELPRYLSDNKTWYSAPQPWRRTGPGSGTDGLPKFDLGRFDDAYFERLRERVKVACERSPERALRDLERGCSPVDELAADDDALGAP